MFTSFFSARIPRFLAWFTTVLRKQSSGGAQLTKTSLSIDSVKRRNDNVHMRNPVLWDMLTPLGSKRMGLLALSTPRVILKRRRSGEAKSTRYAAMVKESK